MLDSTELIRELVAIPGPPGQERLVRDAVAAHVSSLGYESSTDAKGNLIVRVRGRRRASKTQRPDDPMTRQPRVVVTAHLDEIALMVSRVDEEGKVRVIPLGGVYPWKWGEQPVSILVGDEPIRGILSFGSIHTSSPISVAEVARSTPLQWDMAYVFTGHSRYQLAALGVRPGIRVVIDPSRRQVTDLGQYLCSYFIDDRADLAAWLLALESLKDAKLSGEVLFAATASEEVGGEGASYLLHKLQPDICVALEIGPSVPESRFIPDEQPTIWVTDNFASISAEDIAILAEVAEGLDQAPHWQALSRGGSDASATAQRGLTARPVTLGLPVENSHGYEIMHRDAPAELARLLVAYLNKVA